MRYIVPPFSPPIVKQDSVEYGLKFEANPSKFNSTIVSTVKGSAKTSGLPGYTNEAMHFKQPGGDFNSILLIPLQKDLGIKSPINPPITNPAPVNNRARIKVYAQLVVTDIKKQGGACIIAVKNDPGFYRVVRGSWYPWLHRVTA